MPITMQAPYHEPESATTRWVTIFILLSLLAHAVIVLVILLLTRFMPMPKLPVPVPPSDKVTLTMIPPPPVPPAPKQKPVFIPTAPQPDAQHKQQPIISANDHDLMSHMKTATKPDAPIPEMTGAPKAPDMRTSPQVTAPQTPQVSSTPPTPKQETPTKPAPQAPKPQMAEKVAPRPVEAPPRPPHPETQKKPEQQVDPLTGLPVLPPLQAPTMVASQQAHPLAPAPSQQQVQGSQHGALGRNGDNSPAAMATDLGKYKQEVYAEVGSYWYPKIDKQFGTVGIGVVTIRFTIHSDGTLTDVVVTDGNDQTILRDISLAALRSPAPYKPFSPGMIKEVGDSYTDEFNFSMYSP